MIPRPWQASVLAVACLGFSCPPVVSAELRYELTVAAGGHDRANTPVCVLLEEPSQQANLNPALLEKAASVTLRDASGKDLPAQLTKPGLLRKTTPGAAARELHFILPSLKQGQTLELAAVLSDVVPDRQGFRWQDTPGEHAKLSHEKRPILRYMYQALDESSKANREKTFKVYHHLYNPAGTRLVTNGPAGLYPHHRGLFFGFSRISYGDGITVNNWGCSGPAYQAHRKIVSEEAGPVLGRHQAVIEWHGHGDKVIAEEQRELTVYNVPGGHLVEFATRVHSKVGKMKLDGDAQHAGFQFRADNEVAAEHQKLTYYLRPSGKGASGETRNPNRSNREQTPQCKNLPWNAVSFVLGGERYTAVYLDSPSNPKPAWYSEREYGRFGSFFICELDEEKDLRASYRIWLQDTEMTVQQAEALSTDFVEPVKVAVRQ